MLALAPKNVSDQQRRPVVVEQGENCFAVVITGMGVGNARIKADAALGLARLGPPGGPPTAQKPEAILVIGFCGGLTETMPKYRIVAYSECLCTDKSPSLQCSLALADAIFDKLERQHNRCDRVIGITSQQIAASKDEKLALVRLRPSVVDMESHQLLSAAARARVPAAVLRVVSDSLDADMPDFNPALEANGGLIGSKAIWIALGSPLETFRLLSANKRVMVRLALAIELILQSNCFANLKRPVKN